MENIGEDIENAVASELTECKKGLASPKGRKTDGRSQSAANVDIAEVVAKVITALQPVLISVISAAVKASSEAMLQGLRSKPTTGASQSPLPMKTRC